MTFKVAFYGNNLNQGYFFVRSLTEHGLEAKLFCENYYFRQEHHDWWTEGEPDSSLVVYLNTRGFECGMLRRLSADPDIKKLYQQVKNYDLLVMMEWGPALFSELQGVKKVFLSAGGDLQIYPFMLSVYLSPRIMLRKIWYSLNAILNGSLHLGLAGSRSLVVPFPQYAMSQARQRAGLRQCAALLCSPHQTALVDQLRLDHAKVHYLPFPMDSAILTEVDHRQVNYLKEKYADVDILFFHPTRQFYLRETNDRFLKDNDKLLYAYARFVAKTDKRVKLALVLKGREPDIAYSQRLIKQLGLEAHIEWLPEMPNKQLRAYYAFDQVIVCDQYNPNLAVLGNIGREATFFGRPLITAFNEWNRALYGEDMPPHVFPAQTADQIFAAMGKVAFLNRENKIDLENAARWWYQRHLDSGSVMPKYIELLSKVYRG